MTATQTTQEARRADRRARRAAWNAEAVERSIAREAALEVLASRLNS